MMLNRRQVALHRSHTDPDDGGYMSGAAEERFLEVWELTREVWASSRRRRMLNVDYKEMLQWLLEEDVKLLLVCACAVAVYCYPGDTKGLQGR